MNVTKNEIKDRQLHIEDYLQMVSAEQKEYAEVSVHSRITENNDISTDFQTDELLEQILQPDNLNKAYKKVKSNKGAGGVDGMSVDELLTFLKNNQKKLVQKLKDGKYKPNPVRRVEIPKETKGETRKLGVPTVVDRVFQQAITQVLSPIYEKQFSENSYGFRPKRGAHDALKQCQQNVNDGYVYVVDMDLEKFFDTVCQSKLVEVLSRTIKDGRVISLIHKYLNAGVVSNGMFEKTNVGMPQGGPLSPLLSNIMLNELDKELERRGHRFVRYADDCMIFCKSRKSAIRTLENIMPHIEGKLFLKVNREKTKVAHISKVRYLGYSFYRYKGKCRLRVHPKSIAKMKAKLKELTSRSNGWGNEYRALKLTQFIRGWVNYFGMADMKQLLRSTDEWLRRKIRAIYWKQWKKIKTRYQMIKKFGMPEWKVHEMANCRKGIWRSAIMLNSVLTNKVIASLGYISMADYYLKICKN
ncbi:group II intron reverse transcriptase/maturase [Alkalibaculum bacchi]|uniref:Group II intron reverse transcriptase/maturase n=1 Tax=Alkalibaculum bacchi TaxID=645887 RepID=A0A366IBD7_9FIRM|nr:group II intron reverse transcriptase/maturase [Alkalibaculum bacchi]RBP66750.1 group II intron reverse transcriptase/maturase [Alkalibaculum bacchi]